MQYVLKINGKDFTDVIAAEGYGVTRNDLDDENSGRTMDAVMHRAVIATKVTLKVDFIPLTSDRLSELINVLERDFVTVEYYDIKSKAIKTGVFYNSNRGGTGMRTRRTPRLDEFTGRWLNVSINLIER